MTVLTVHPITGDEKIVEMTEAEYEALKRLDPFSVYPADEDGEQEWTGPGDPGP